MASFSHIDSVCLGETRCTVNTRGPWSSYPTVYDRWLNSPDGDLRAYDSGAVRRLASLINLGTSTDPQKKEKMMIAESGLNRLRQAIQTTPEGLSRCAANVLPAILSQQQACGSGCRIVSTAPPRYATTLMLVVYMVCLSQKYVAPELEVRYVIVPN